MSDITGNEDVAMAAETGTALEGNSVLTDLVVEDMDIQLSPSLQNGVESTANARAMAYRDRILEATGRSKETSYGVKTKAKNTLRCSSNQGAAQKENNKYRYVKTVKKRHCYKRSRR